MHPKYPKQSPHKQLAVVVSPQDEFLAHSTNIRSHLQLFKVWFRKSVRSHCGLQATGEGMDTKKHAATLTLGWPGMHGP